MPRMHYPSETEKLQLHFGLCFPHRENAAEGEGTSASAPVGRLRKGSKEPDVSI